MAKYTLTDGFIKKIKPESLKSTRIYFDDHKDAPRGFGIRVTPAGSKSWVLNYYVSGREHRLTLKKPYPAWGPKIAREKATAIKVGIGSGDHPLADKKAAKQAQIDKAELTLGTLCAAYVEQLRRDGKSSARAVETCLQRNIEKAFPDYWNTPADDVDLDNFLNIVATLTDAGKKRQAAKLRSYLRAAYSAAIRARTDATATKSMRAFKLKHNPVSELAPIAGNIQAREHVLSLPELRLYYQRISALRSPDGSVLKFHLLTGGQRLEQLFRLTSNDLDGDMVTLRDSKGRRQTPRAHVVPLLPEAQTALDAIGGGPYLISFDGGETQATDAAFRGRFKAVCSAMLESKEVKEPFTPGDVRRTVETRLAAAGVTSDVLAQLLSHGLGGVQQRHYQRHEYRAEKLEALTTLRTLLTDPSGDVVPMKRRVKK